MKSIDTLINNRYKVLKVLGTGGMSEVYHVFDIEKKTERALKLLTPYGSEQEYITLFQREFLTLSKIKHPNIVKVYDYGKTSDDEYYFTMELILGNFLQHSQFKNKYETLLKVFINLLQTLQFIHSKGLIHGDIKPQNIIVKNKSKDIIITDFGMVEKVSLVENKPIQGTLTYMSPEVIRASAVDQRADIYSFGVLAYEIISGISPFNASDPITILRQHLSFTPPELKEVARKCPDYLSSLVMKCLEKNPRNRFQSADEIIKEIARNETDLTVEEGSSVRESYILTADFVGRRKELGYLIRNLELALGGNGQTVFIGGEAGMGKSRLMEEFRIYSQLQDYSVLQAKCYEKEARPHQTMVTLCHQLLLLTGKKNLELVKQYANELRKLSPEFDFPKVDLDTNDKISHLDPSIERTRFYDALTQFVIEVSKIEPLVILIENLHWVDQVTLGILQYLIRNLSNANIMICGTFQNEVLYSSSLWGGKNLLETMVDENADNPNFHEISMANLKPGDVASMVGSMLGMAFKPEEFGRILHEETGGNPFIITEIMKQLVNENVIFREKGEWIIDVDDFSNLSIPLSVREIYQRRLERLSPKSLALLDYFSIPQTSIDFQLLLAFSGVNENELFEEIYELLHLELISQKGNNFEFSNPLIREIIYNALSPHRKTKMHAQFGDLLIKTRNNPEAIVNELAYHFVKGNERKKALKFSVLAAEISERVYAHEQAAEHYERVLNLAQEEDVSLKIKFLKKLVDLYMMNGNYKLAMEKLETVFKFAKNEAQLSVKEICALNRKMAGIYQKMGEYYKALKYLYDSLNHIKSTDEVFLRAQIHTNLGNIYMFLGDLEKALTHCHTSLEIVEPLGDLREISEIYNTYGKIFVRKHALEKALHFFTKSLQLRERIGDTLGIGRTYGNLGIISNDMGFVQEAEDYYLSGLKIFEKIGFIYGSAIILNNLGILYHQRKTDWEKAISFLTKAMELHERTGNEFGVAMTCMNLGLIFKDLGEVQEATKFFNRSIQVYSRLNNKSMETRVKILFASLLLDQEKTDKVLDLLLECRKQVETAASDDDVMGIIWLELGRYYLQKEELEASLGSLHRAVLIARKVIDAESEGYIRILEAKIHHKKGDFKQEEKSLLRSVTILEREGAVFLLAKSYWALGDFYHHQNQEQKALEFVEKARDLFQKIGVRSYYEVTQDLLSRMRERVLPTLFKLEGASDDIATLYRISHEIISTLDLPTLLEKILDSAIKTVNAERGLIILYDEIRKSYEVKTARNMDRKTSDDMATVSGGVVERTVSQGIPILSTDAGVDPRFKQNQSVILFNIKSILCVPLKIKQKVIGALYLDNRALTNLFTEKDLDFLVVLANQAAISIDNALLYERYRSATDDLNVGIIVVEKNGHILNLNNKAAEILNVEPESVKGYRFSADKDAIFFPEIGKVVLEALKTGSIIEKEITVRLSSQEEKIIDFSTSLIYDGFGECIGNMGIFRDITSFKIMQEELDLRKRMNAIGDLAAKISHRMKNYLTGIKILSQEMKKHVDADELKAEYLDEILLEVAASEKYVLNELSPQKIKLTGSNYVDINSMFNEIKITNQKDSDAKNINIILELKKDLPQIAADPVQLKEVFNNLIINAMQAVISKGSINIKTNSKDNWIEIKIIDDGKGIPESVREKIFEPFFTTKDGGSGVGLWVAHSVITHVGGKINVKSRENIGTTFTILLPVNSN